MSARRSEMLQVSVAFALTDSDGDTLSLTVSAAVPGLGDKPVKVEGVLQRLNPPANPWILAFGEIKREPNVGETRQFVPSTPLGLSDLDGDDCLVDAIHSMVIQWWHERNRASDA